MIHLLHGTDAYERSRALSRIKKELGFDDPTFASNLIVLDGRAVTPQELLAHAASVPFLAPHRLIVVEGLIGALAANKGRKKKDDDPLAPWRDAAARLADPAQTPESTVVVMVEGDVAKTAAFKVFAPVAEVRQFEPPKGEALRTWIAREAKERGLKIDARAVAALAALAGGDLWALSGELDKLASYAQGAAVGEAEVRELVASAQEAKSWDVTDPLVAGDEARAVGAMARMLAEGEPPARLSSMVVRAHRQLVLAKDMSERMASRDAVAKATGTPDWKTEDLIKLARRWSWPSLRRAYALMLEADLNVKRGVQDDASALQLLVHELARLAPAPAYARR